MYWIWILDWILYRIWLIILDPGLDPPGNTKNQARPGQEKGTACSSCGDKLTAWGATQHECNTQMRGLERQPSYDRTKLFITELRTPLIVKAQDASSTLSPSHAHAHAQAHAHGPHHPPTQELWM